MFPIENVSDEQILQIAKQLRVAYILKRTLRYGTKRDFAVHSESVAEHVFALMFLAQYFIQNEKIGPSLDISKLYQILLFHDFPEIKYGDVPYNQKTIDQEEKEKGAAGEVFDALPFSLQKMGYESWREYEAQEIPESRFARALDMLEPLFELLDPINERSMKDLKFSYDEHMEKKFKSTEEFPVMRRFLDVISKDMLHRDVFWNTNSTSL